MMWNITTREKTVQQFGNGFGLYLSQELHSLGINKGDKVYVTQLDDRIVISKKPDVVAKPAGVDEELWHTFLIAMQMKKKKGNLTTEDVLKSLNEAIELWIEEQRTVLKIEIPILKKVIPTEKELNLENKD